MANPFNADDKAKINAALKAITEVKADITKAKLAGIDVSEAEKRLNVTEAALSSIKRVYFAGK
jgi:hypothetical protein